MARRNTTAFIAVKLRDAAATKRVITILRGKLKDNEILSTSDFVKRTIMYWTAQTGMGAALCLTAVLGLVVGTGVIGQTIFANTMEHLAELATLKAMGATRSDLYTVIIGQALINVLAGYGVATLLVVLSKPVLERTGVSLALSVPLIGGLLVLMLGTSVAAAFFSVRRVRRVDPAIVLRS
jgi:putative ABC transport system permease protein